MTDNAIANRLSAQIQSNEIHALFSKGSRKASLLRANKKMMKELLEITKPETEMLEMNDAEMLASLGL